MSDLFADAAPPGSDGRATPAATSARTLEELVGQRHVLAEGSALRRAIESDRAPSMILFGPPGVGKTTLARIVAARTGAIFEELSAVSARVDDVRAVIQRARDRLGGNGMRTILFLDEIHRFDKRQQDSVLGAVEEGLVTLIGATTENPYFEVNAALLSRCTVIELESLSDAEVESIVRRGAATLEVEPTDDARGGHRAPSRRRRTNRAGDARARARDRDRRGCPAHGRARRGRGAKETAPLRPGRGPALRLRVRLHQEHARR